AAQDRNAAVAAWREALSDLEEATRLAPYEHSGVPAAAERISVELSAEDTAALVAVGRRHGLTLNTLVQGAWGIVLGRLTGRNDVVFGVTVAGRPAEIAGVENMIGLFINTVPLRLRLPAGKQLIELLVELQ